jgi:type I restriction enzyme R subunit
MPEFTESSTVQAWLIERLVGLGWTHVPGKELPRSSIDVLCEEWLIEAIEILNLGVRGVPDRVDEILPKIRSTILSAGIEGLLAANERMTTLLRGDSTIKFVGSDEYVISRICRKTLLLSLMRSFLAPRGMFVGLIWCCG